METYDRGQLLAVNAVESLRAGVPTRISTRELPDLRQQLTDRVRVDLLTFYEGRIPRGRIIWGQYGQGKTHVLTTVEHTALDMGFAVSMVSLSREVSCHNLLQFYGRVAPRVRTPDSTMLGLERALAGKDITDLADSPVQEEERYIHPLPALVLEDYFYTSGEDQNLLYGDLTGICLPTAELKRIHRQSRQTGWPKLPYPFKVTEHATAYFGVMADVIHLCGYKGWVILIDEVELTGRLGTLARLKAYRNLHWLLNWSGSMQYPIYTLAAAATRLQDDIWYGGGKDDRNRMPKLAEEKFGAECRREMGIFF
ncbi:BREX system ATP-binding domain-containing protein [Sporomusa sp.]|uniref:BREX system ATP-binding domain-containing protein n=1 Tax=Sporomusa sp. TaxID=2078658 RepID=UPI002CE3A1A7|nr:BREX system ATP-binding domain-containing protein [Sporomusa sp.]HWR45808.1 BREX system ATP-binding domain-containing protein [Sporomusa sp.]